MRGEKIQKWQLSWLSTNAPESRTGTLHSLSLQSADCFVM